MNNPIIHLLKLVWKYSPSKKLLVFFVLLSALANVISLLSPLVVGWVFNTAQFDSADPNVFLKVLGGLSLIVLISLVFWALHGPSRILEKKHAFLVELNFRQEMFDKVLELPAGWHKEHHSGDTIDKIKKASKNLFDFSSELFFLVGGVVTLLGSVIILGFFDPKSLIAAFVVMILGFSTIVFFDKKLVKGYKKVFEGENYIASAIHDYVSNILTVITLRLKRKASSEVRNRSMRPFKTYLKNSKINEWKWFLINFYIAIGTALILIANAYYSYKSTGLIVIGSLFILYKYLEGIGSTFYTFAWKWGETVSQAEATNQVREIESTYKNISAKKKYILPQGWKTIQIKKLEFSYDNPGSIQDQSINIASITGVNLVFSKGQKTAFVGESGSGKSTVFSLMRGLHDADSGKVYCDGKTLRDGLKHLNNYSLLIPQDPELFNASVRENITMGLSAAKEKIEKALELSRFNVVVRKLRKGLETNVMEKGVSLSGGEKQRLALARGLLVAPKYEFLLLDEPTSSVDNENERIIYENIFKEFSNKTIFSAVHRLHMLRNFDYIYFFQSGKIVAEGTFEEMLNEERFKVLWKNYEKSIATNKEEIGKYDE